MSTAPTGQPRTDQPPAGPSLKPAWRFARERRLGRRARALVAIAPRELPRALAVVGPESALAASRQDSWALACLERAADADDGSPLQEAWVLLAATRPTDVRRAVNGPPPPTRTRHFNRHRNGPRAAGRAEQQ